eukprot:TRINITY_DN8830_c0_g1_i1.p1 TRINITY_DN8830_c0_g1~~TRINITY_DN8830_c0_g1_i1.p1  ORF type:complete len:381 (+),score=99.38 TRINITY_DN8830_c0_g1_i1:87-1229(+)
MFGIAARVIGAAGVAVGASVVGRSWGGARSGDTQEDGSFAHVNIRDKLPKKIFVEYTEGDDGQTQIGIIDAEAYSEVVRRQIIRFEKARFTLKENARENLEADIEPTFKGMNERIPRFADWYFAYSTTYYFFSKVVTSAASNIVNVARTDTLKDSIARDIESMIHDKYKAIVLRPDLSDPTLQRAFTKSLGQVHGLYLTELERCERELVEQVQAKIPHVVGKQLSSFKLDWRAQAAKTSHLNATFEKSPNTSLGIVAAGSLVGKAAGSAVATKTAGGTLASKLAAPFLSASTIGTTAAGLLAGPGGALVGAGIGLSIDAVINKTTELMQRSQFEGDVEVAVASAKEEWESLVLSEIARSIDVWIDDSVQSLHADAGTKPQ